MNESERKRKDSRKRIKTLKGRGQSKDPSNIDVPQGDSPKDDSNLIYVGGIANFHEHQEGKSFRQMREDIRKSQELQERKNSRKKKTKNPSTEGGDPRSQKIRALKNRTGGADELWSGLEWIDPFFVSFLRAPVMVQTVSFLFKLK